MATQNPGLHLTEAAALDHWELGFRHPSGVIDWPDSDGDLDNTDEPDYLGARFVVMPEGEHLERLQRAATRAKCILVARHITASTYVPPAEGSEVTLTGVVVSSVEGERAEGFDAERFTDITLRVPR